jgi:hypothetical protein
MISRVHRSGTTATRAIAIFGAALLLVSQTIGAAHFHDGVASHDGVAFAQLTVDEALCPLCQFALHSPGSISSPATVARGPVIFQTLLLPVSFRPRSPVFSAARMRAPPGSL